MKKTLFLYVALLTVLVICCCQTAKAQTNTGVQLPITLPISLNMFTNFPDTSPDLAAFGVSAGAITLRGNPENYIKGDLNFGGATNFWSSFRGSAEIYNAPESTGIDAVAGYLGYRMMTSSNYEVAVEGFVRRSFANVNLGLITPSWSGGAQLDPEWRALTGNYIYFNTPAGIESPTTSGGRWSQYLKVGVKVHFGKHF